MSTENDDGGCPWLDRVSAHLDGELSEIESQMVGTHLRSCPTCRSLLSLSSAEGLLPQRTPRTETVSFPHQRSPVVRVALAIVGALILAGSTPDFVRGNTMGDALHDLRHLAMWQVSIGVAFMVSAVTFRMSRLITTMLMSFLALTGGAVVYDVVTGHRGPWTDTTHIVEVVAVVLVMRLVWPHLRLGLPSVPNWRRVQAGPRT